MTDKGKILIIDDDPDICQLLQRYLRTKGYGCETTFRGSKGMAMLQQGDFDLVLCDLRMPDMDGMEILEKVAQLQLGVPVILITGYSDVKMAVKAMKKGAKEYVTKPIHPEEIMHIIQRTLADNEQQPRQVASKPKSSAGRKHPAVEYLHTDSSQSQRLDKLAKLVAPTDLTVLITGESGTGKEVLARRIHAQSKRKRNPFVAVDCGALPKDLATSELFGHAKGAFTGALKDKKGQFELAEGGTLFLDEVGNLSYDNQVRLLRVLQERQIKRLGDTKNIEVDIRIIAATNEDLKAAMEKGNFREDIFFRLNEFNINMPALRERKDDIEAFAHFFLEQANHQLEKTVAGFEKKVLQKLKAYPWPGNLREMRNTITRSTLLAESDKIKVAVLPQEIVHFIPGMSTNEEPESFVPGKTLKEMMEQVERKIILQALVHAHYNKSRTADLLGVDRKTLYNKINAYNIKTTF